MIPNYRGGSTIEKIGDGSGRRYVRVYNNTGGALANGAIRNITEIWITGIGVVAVPLTAGTNATTSNVIGIVDDTRSAGIPDADYGLMLVEGLYGSVADAYGAATSGTVAANDQLEVINAGTALIDSGGNGGEVWLDESCALAVANVTTNVWVVYLIGRQTTIAAA